MFNELKHKLSVNIFNWFNSINGNVLYEIICKKLKNWICILKNIN